MTMLRQSEQPLIEEYICLKCYPHHCPFHTLRHIEPYLKEIVVLWVESWSLLHIVQINLN